MTGWEPFHAEQGTHDFLGLLEAVSPEGDAEVGRDIELEKVKGFGDWYIICHLPR